MEGWQAPHLYRKPPAAALREHRCCIIMISAADCIAISILSAKPNLMHGPEQIGHQHQQVLSLVKVANTSL